MKKLPPHIQVRMDRNFLESKKQHQDELSANALKKRISEQKRTQSEKDRLYDLENSEKISFSWED